MGRIGSEESGAKKILILNNQLLQPGPASKQIHHRWKPDVELSTGTSSLIENSVTTN